MQINEIISNGASMRHLVAGEVAVIEKGGTVEMRLA